MSNGSKWGISHTQWGLLANLGLALSTITLLDWSEAKLVFGFAGVVVFGVSFWLFTSTAEGARKTAEGSPSNAAEADQ